MKTFIWLSLAFVLAASVAVLSLNVRAESTASHVY
jgi:hypothetical protein